MEINERWIKIRGKMATEDKLELGKDLAITIKGQIVKLEYLDNQDGTKDVVYIVKLLNEE